MTQSCRHRAASAQGWKNAAPQSPPHSTPWGQAAPPAVLRVSSFPSAGRARLGTHGAARTTLSLRALRQLGGAVPILAEQGLHTVDDVPDAVDEAIPL